MCKVREIAYCFGCLIQHLCKVPENKQRCRAAGNSVDGILELLITENALRRHTKQGKNKQGRHSL